MGSLMSRTVWVEHGALELDHWSLVWVLLTELQGEPEGPCRQAQQHRPHNELHYIVSLAQGVAGAAPGLA